MDGLYYFLSHQMLAAHALFVRACMRSCASLLFSLWHLRSVLLSVSVRILYAFFSFFLLLLLLHAYFFFPSKHMRAGPAVAPLLFSFLLLPLGSSLLFIFLSTFIFNVVSNYFIDNFSSARKIYSFFILFPILSFCNCSIVSI